MDITEEAPVEETCADRETVHLDTPGASPTMEDAEKDSMVEVETPDRGRAETVEALAKTVKGEVVEKGKARVEKPKWGWEGYGVCIGCAEIYIVRCDGQESP